MTKEDYILHQAKELVRIRKKRDKLRSINLLEVTQKKAQAISTDLNWLGMDYSKTEERLGYALGLLNIGDLRDEYEPSGFHRYPGIKGEVAQLKFD